MKTRPVILTIAGSDSGAGAGVQADARTIHALGGYAAMAITAITAQNSLGVAAWRPVPVDMLAAQIEAVVGDYKVAAIKTGLLPGAAAVRAIVAALKIRPTLPLVVDPVLGSTSGTRFLTEAGVRALKKELLPRAALVTPNWPEAESLSGLPVRSFAEAEAAAREILKTGCGAVLVKGGHAPGAKCRDCLATADGRLRWFESPRIATKNAHGTGCVLSAALATELGRGAPMVKAVQHARRFLLNALRGGRKLRLGQGRGPAFAG